MSWEFTLPVPVSEWQDVESVLMGSSSTQFLSAQCSCHIKPSSLTLECYGKWPQLPLCSFPAQVAHLSLCPCEVINWQLSRWIMTRFQTYRKTKFVTNQQILWTHDEAPRAISSRQVQAWDAPLGWRAKQALAEQLCYLICWFGRYAIYFSLPAVYLL